MEIVEWTEATKFNGMTAADLEHVNRELRRKLSENGSINMYDLYVAIGLYEDTFENRWLHSADINNVIFRLEHTD